MNDLGAVSGPFFVSWADDTSSLVPTLTPVVGSLLSAIALVDGLV